MIVKMHEYTKVLRGAVLLDNVTLQMESGHIYGLKGKNGSGKTMLLRALAGLIQPTSGELTFDDKPLERGTFPPSLGLLIESPAFVNGWSGVKNLTELALIRSRVDEAAVQRAIEDVGLDPASKKPVRSYSLGMRQRLGIACALMEQPDLILLDEPTNALDGSGCQRVCELLARERERGALVVVTCHDAPEVEALLDESFFLAEGHLELFPYGAASPGGEPGATIR